MYSNTWVRPLEDQYYKVGIPSFRTKLVKRCENTGKWRSKLMRIVLDGVGFGHSLSGKE